MNAPAHQPTCASQYGVIAKPGTRTLTIAHNSRVLDQQTQLPQPWEDAIAGWTSWLRVAGKRDSTIHVRRGHLRTIARRSRSRHPCDLDLNALVGLCSERAWSKEHRKGVRSSLISFYEWCVMDGVVDANPALRLPRIPPPTPCPRPTPDNVWLDLLEVAAPRERLMARLAGEAGLRRAEVAVVHSDDLIHDGSGWSLLVHGKGGKQRVLGITNSLASEIRSYCTRHGYLFPGQIDGHISPQWVGIMISKLMPPGWSMHKLRHRFATRGYAGTGNLRAVQEALGHASVATTQRYTAVTGRDVRSVSEAASKMPVLSAITNNYGEER